MGLKFEVHCRIEHRSKNRCAQNGRAADQGVGYPGGGYQAVVQEVPRSWIIRTDKAFK